ncbi:hypothetical protein D3C72_2509400 [compost metagenome]
MIDFIRQILLIQSFRPVGFFVRQPQELEAVCRVSGCSSNEPLLQIRESPALRLILTGTDYISIS